MNDTVRTVAGWLGGLALMAFALAAIYLTGKIEGERAADARHAEQMRAIDAQVADERAEQNRRLMRLTDRIDELRARPERVRTVTREVVKHVVPDAECSSVPESVRRLWDAGRAGRPAAGTASMGDAGVSAVAGAGR